MVSMKKSAFPRCAALLLFLLLAAAAGAQGGKSAVTSGTRDGEASGGAGGRVERDPAQTPVQAAEPSPPVGPEAPVPPRKILLFYRDEAGGPALRDKVLLRETLLVSLRGVRADCFILEADPLAGPDSDDDKSSLARRGACDGWLSVRVSDAPAGRLRGEYTLYDSVSLSYAARGAFEAEKPDIRDLARVFWRDAAAALEKLAPLDPLPPLVTRGVPGTRVYGLGKRSLRLDGDGSARVVLPTPGIYSLRAEKAGYDPVEKQVLYRESGGEILLDQKRGSLFSLDFSLENARYPAVSLSWFPVPNMVFLKTGAASYAAGIVGFVVPPDEGSGTLRVSYPYANLSSQVGFYIRPPDSFFRPYLGGGIVARFFFGRDRAYVDPAVPFGGFPVLGCEFSRDPKNRFFVEATPTFYYAAKRSPDPFQSFEDFMADRLEGLWGAGFNIGDRWHIEVFSFRLGYRKHF